ncbi:MAG: FmdB family transcriptional regulator [Gammaproteobacteria bacterium]|nr:MAG: FmdB family transcriptional regulator [Gammaproteobacteria bacterium]
MPIYEYRCTACDHRLEKLQRMADDPLKDCPECNKPALKKLVSAAAFKLKGSGWYETDFKGKDKPSSESNKSGETSNEGASSDKPSAKSDNKTSKETAKKGKSEQSKSSTTSTTKSSKE